MGLLFCSTGALLTRKNNRDHRLLAEIAPGVRCDGFEFMMYDTWYDTWEKIAEDVAKMKLRIPVFHVEKRIGERISRNEEGDNADARRLFEINCRMARRFGAEKLVLHLWGGIYSDRDIKNNIEQYALLRETAEKYGLLLTVENVVCNREDPLLHMKELAAEYPDISFTVDVRFAQFHGQLDRIFEEEYGWLWEGAVKHLHFSDYAGGYMEWEKLGKCLHPREGVIDYGRLFENIRRVGYRGTSTLESTSVLPDGRVDLEKLNGSLEYLRSGI